MIKNIHYVANSFQKFITQLILELHESTYTRFFFTKYCVICG